MVRTLTSTSSEAGLREQLFILLVSVKPFVEGSSVNVRMTRVGLWAARGTGEASFGLSFASC